VSLRVVVTGRGEAIGKSKRTHKHDSGCLKAAERVASQLRRPKLSFGPPFTSRLEICAREARRSADFCNLPEHNFGVRHQNEICES